MSSSYYTPLRTFLDGCFAVGQRAVRYMAMMKKSSFDNPFE
jgi:hypothetical protein